MKTTTNAPDRGFYRCAREKMALSDGAVGAALAAREEMALFEERGGEISAAAMGREAYELCQATIETKT